MSWCRKLFVLLCWATQPDRTAVTLWGQEWPKLLGLRLMPVTARTSDEIDAAFTTLVHDQADALFVEPDPFLGSSRDQLVALAARRRIPAVYSSRSAVEAGGLMS
jgi:ABC-type uncharacterized transport system substrate-binding protein